MIILETQLSKDAKQYVKNNKKDIINKFANIDKYPKSDIALSIFMAGSPGAGKTEVAKRLIETVEYPTVHIDADEIKKELPQYTGKNSSLVHGAASIGVDKIFDSCLHNSQSFILDGLFADYDRAIKNIDRCLGKNRIVYILYIFQDPIYAWKFTQAREEKEGRHISKDVFIHGLFESRKVVKKIKEYYSDRIKLFAILKDYNNETKQIWEDIEDIDKHVPIVYSVQDIKSMI